MSIQRHDARDWRGVHRMLTLTLRGLERDRLVSRTAYGRAQTLSYDRTG